MDTGNYAEIESYIEHIERYINEVTPIINDFILDQELDYEGIEQNIYNHQSIHTMLEKYFNELQNINYEEIQKLKDKIEAIAYTNQYIIIQLNNLQDANTKESAEKEEDSNNNSNEDMSADSDDNVQHVFMFVCHGSEYNPTGRRNLYPFENNDYDSVGIISTYGESAYIVPEINQKLMHTANILSVLECDTMGVLQDNKRFLTVNPLSMQFKFNDVNEPTLGPYMGLFYLKVKEIEKNNIKLIEMKHLIRFKPRFEIKHTTSGNIDLEHQIDGNCLQTLHKIKVDNDGQTIDSEFLDEIIFGWDVVFNVISRFYKKFLNDSKIRMNEPVHIRLFCCRNPTEEVIGKGTGRYGGMSLVDQTLFNVKYVAIAQPDDTNMRYFWMTNEKVNNFRQNIYNFNDFISAFISLKPFYCDNKITIIYFLMLLDNDISNINLLLERLCTIFLDIEEMTPLSLLVMLSCNKTTYDIYKSKHIDITEYLSYSYQLINEDVTNLVTNHIISNIISGCQRLAFGEGLKIYFMGTDENDITLPYVLFIILDHETQLVVSLNCINIENEIYKHQQETHTYHPQQFGVGINEVLKKFNNIEIIYNNNIQGKGGMNNKGSNYKKTGKTLSQVLGPNRPLRPRSKYGRSYEVKIKEHDSSQAIEQMKEFDKRQPTGIFNFNPNPSISLTKPVEHDSQGTDITDIDFMTPGSTPRTTGGPYTTPPRNTNYSTPGSAVTDKEGSPGDTERGQGIMFLPGRSISPPIDNTDKKLTYKNPDYGLPPQSKNIKSSPKSYEDLMALEAQKALEAMTKSAESLPSNITDNSGSDSEENTQEEDRDFGGKKKGKRGKKTKRAKKVKKAKKARKTKKKRSNKK